jgi:hypothetical protein
MNHLTATLLHTFLDRLEQPSRSRKVYKLLRRSPRSNLNEQFLELLDGYASSIPWVRAWHDEVRRKVQAGKAVAPFRLEDGLWNRDVLILVKAVAELDSSTLERNLSVKLFKNSKWLESLRSALLGVLRRYAPKAALFEGNEWDVRKTTLFASSL